MVKLGARDRAQLVVFAYKPGLAGPVSATKLSTPSTVVYSSPILRLAYTESLFWDDDFAAPSCYYWLRQSNDH